VESARRFNVDVACWPAIAQVDANCVGIEAFRLAAPALQPDAT
jgi:maleylpyruvate isomerase